MRLGTTLVLFLLVTAEARAQPERADFRAVDPATRAAAARRAGQQRDQAAVDGLIELLRDRSENVRFEAVRALAQIGGPMALRRLKVAAQVDFSERVRAVAARAVKRMDPRAYVTTLATSEQPPVRRPEPMPLVRRRAALLSIGGGLNTLSAESSGAAVAGVGLRWPHVELHYSLGFPALTMIGVVRLSPLVDSVVIPYLCSGFAIAFNNRSDELSGPSAALFVGGGLRAHIDARFFLFAELLPSWTVAQPRRPVNLREGSGVTATEERSFALPLLVGLGAELWP